MKNKIFIISGPSGSGQDTVIEGLQKFFDLERVITVTTRPKRVGESDGSPYYFITKEEFLKKIKNNEFIEWAKVYENLYGATFAEIKRVQEICEKTGKIGILKVDWQGVKHVKQAMPEIISIMTEPPSLEVLEKRLINRGTDSPEVIKQRMEETKMCLANKNIYDYRVINEDGKIDEAVEKTVEIIKNNI